MNQAGVEASLFDDIEGVTLNPDLVSRFLSNCDDGESESQRVHTAGETPAKKVSTSILRRPSFYQKRKISNGPLTSDKPNVDGGKPVKYVSEIHFTLNAESQLEPEANGLGLATEIPVKPPAQSEDKHTDNISKPVEYISRIHITNPMPGNREGTFPLGARKKSAAIISNFLTKFTNVNESSPSFRSPKTKYTKQVSTISTNESVSPSSSECLSPTTEYTSTEVTSGDFVREDVTMKLSTSQTLSTFQFTAGDLLPKQVLSTSVLTQETAQFPTITNDVSSAFGHDVDSIKLKKQIDSSSPEMSTFTPKTTIYPSDDDQQPPLPDQPPPLPDQPPPLPDQPPPPLLLSGPMVGSITPEEADFITVFLKSLKTGGNATTSSITTIPECETPLPTDQTSKHQGGNTKHPNKYDTTTKQTTITSVVTKQAPKLKKSPGLPVWPPPPKDANSKPNTSSSSDSSSGDSQWEDAEDNVELRDQVGRDETSADKTNSFGTSGSATASWDLGYSGSNTSSQISWTLPDPETPPLTNADYEADDEENTEEQEEGKEDTPPRLSILELLRINSEAGKKNKLRWHTSVDNDALLDGLSEKQLQLYELEFEMITTEAEYFSRVEFLKKNFLGPNQRSNKKDTLRANSKKNIFLDLDEVCGCSEMLLEDLDKCWQRSVYLRGIFDIVREHSDAKINAFINYCAEYEGVIEKIAVLRKEDRKFEEMVCVLEEGKPDLSEQLKEPMNRIIQLNMLFKSCLDVMTKLSKTDETKSFAKEFESCRSAAKSVAQLCFKVDEVTGMRRRVQKIIEIQGSLEFPLPMTQLSLASQNRWLVKKGALTQNGYLILNTGKKPAYKKSNSAVTIFLFNDLIILAKKKSEVSHVVKDYGQRPGVEMSLTLGMEALPRRLIEDSPGYYTLFLTIEKNHMGGKSHMFLSCTVEAERDDWLNAMKRKLDEFHGL